MPEVDYRYKVNRFQNYLSLKFLVFPSTKLVQSIRTHTTCLGTDSFCWKLHRLKSVTKTNRMEDPDPYYIQ